MLANRLGLTLLLAAIFVVNLMETAAEEWLGNHTELGRDLKDLGYSVAYAIHSFEGNFSFESHDVTNALAVHGYSFSYFFLFPVLGLAVAFALARRKDITPFRVFSLAIAIDYIVSLPFFLVFPVPERWHYPDSEAMLLSDKVSTSLIETIRPISGLDNCFPSTHVSFTVIIILVCYLYQIRLRTSVAALGLTIILSTFVLGIHWLPDMIAGTAVAILSVALARRLSLSVEPSVAV